MILKSSHSFIQYSVARGSLEVRLQRARTADVAGGAVEGTAEGHEVAERHRDYLKAPVLKGLLRGFFVRFHNHGAWAHDQHVASGGPWAGKEQRVRWRELWLGRHEHFPALEHLGQAVFVVLALVRVRLNGTARNARSERIGQQFTRHQRHKGTIDVHGIAVLEVKHVNIVVVAQVAAQPLNAELVGHLALLREDIAAHARELGGIKNRFELSHDRLGKDTRVVHAAQEKREE